MKYTKLGNSEIEVSRICLGCMGFGNAEAGYSQNMALDEENFGVSSQAADTAASVQEKTAFLPDYAFKGSDSAAGTTVSGLVGSAMVAGAAVLICLAGGFFGRRKKRTA